MQTTTHTRKLCMFCNQFYPVTVIYDDGVDWYGHARGKEYSAIVDDRCPHCKGDVVLAAEIVQKQRELEKKRKQRFEEQLKGKYACKVFFDVRGKEYIYISDNKQEADYYIVNNVVVYMSECVEVTSNMFTIELMEKLKMFTGKPINNKRLIELLTKELVRSITQDDMSNAMHTLETIENVKNHSKLVLTFKEKLKQLIEKGAV